MTSKLKHKCPDHGVSLVFSQTRYFGGRWYCPESDCTVILWNGSTSTPADAKTRAARIKAHGSFDELWRGSGFRNRSKAYSWLATQMGLCKDECHIGMFDVEQCRQVMEACQNDMAASSERKDD